jgi:hypothetical protein
MLPADVSLEPGDRTPGLHRRGLMVNAGAGAGRRVGLHAKDTARHVTGHLREADPGTRRVALLAAERESCPYAASSSFAGPRSCLIKVLPAGGARACARQKRTPIQSALGCPKTMQKG